MAILWSYKEGWVKAGFIRWLHIIRNQREMAKTFFNAKDAVIPVFFQRLLLRLLTEEGIEAERLFRGLDISPCRFDDDEFRINFSQHKIFICNAIDAAQDPHLGWRFGQSIKVTSLGMLGYAVMAAENVGSAINVISQFFNIRAPSYDLKLIEADSEDETIVLQIDESFDFGEVRYFMLSCFLSAFQKVFQFLTNDANIIMHVDLACEQPADWIKVESLINFPVTFNATKTRIYFESKSLIEALPTSDPEAARTTRQICEKMAEATRHCSGVVKEVNEFILATRGKYPTLSDTADHLCMSPRTLRRELQKSNTTYQKLLDNVREKFAKELLLNTAKTHLEIAFELGYKDASNFNRAFKAWTGVSPGEFRLHQSSL